MGNFVESFSDFFYHLSHGKNTSSVDNHASTDHHDDALIESHQLVLNFIFIAILSTLVSCGICICLAARKITIWRLRSISGSRSIRRYSFHRFTSPTPP